IKALERQSRLLGLDAPAKHEVAGLSGAPINAPPEIQLLMAAAEKDPEAAAKLRGWYVARYLEGLDESTVMALRDEDRQLAAEKLTWLAGLLPLGTKTAGG